MDVETASAEVRSGGTRRSAVLLRLVLAAGIVLAGVVLFLLAFRLPDANVLHEAGTLRASVARLGWQAAQTQVPGQDAPVPGGGALQRAAGEVERELLALKNHLQHEDIDSAALPAFESRWHAVRASLAGSEPAVPSLPVLQTLAAAADTLAAAVRDQLQLRRERLEAWLKVLTVLLAATLLLPLHGMWRQRQRMRASLHQFSDHLGAGDWQDAVQSLRDERLGPPSAFDALASGVEGVMVETERRWQALADLSADWYWESDALHRISRLSGSAPTCTVQGWRNEDLLGRRRDQIAFYEAPSVGWAAFHEHLERQRPFRDIEFAVRPRQGDELVWVSISGRPRLDAHGDFVGYEGMGRDVTERKSAHEKLIASEERWSLMAGLSSDWYWETDAEHRMRPLSPELYRRFGDMAERVEGRTRWEAHSDALSPAQWTEHRADLDAHRPFRGLQYEMESGGGRFLWVSISGIPRFDGQGRFLGYRGIGRDVTVRKQAERLLLRHNEELQRAVAERTQELQQLNLDLDAFARQLAHELRTPIGHVQGLARLIDSRAGDRLTAEERGFLEMQVQAARSMRDTVDALLELARSTVQAMPMEAVDVSALASAVAAELPALTREAAVAWHIQPGLLALASPAALRIVLANLLGNAAKFTRKITAPEVRLSGSYDVDGRLRICIQDNGAGFDASQSARLFTAFSRLHAGEDFQGTGIGLTIVQRIVERHGGTVAAFGAPGDGARFEFTLTPQRPRAIA